MPLTLHVLPGEYAVCRLGPQATPPDWAWSGPLCSVTRTPAELSIVCRAQDVPPEVEAQRGWAALELQGPFAFTLTGILASVLGPLRDAALGIFALSTFDTDYVLVPGAQVRKAVEALRAAGHSVVE